MRLAALASIAALAMLLTACETTNGGRQIPARFNCEDGGRLNLVFDHDQDAVVLRLPQGQSAVLPNQHPSAGMWFMGAGYELRGAGDTMRFSAPNKTQTLCRQSH